MSVEGLLIHLWFPGKWHRWLMVWTFGCWPKLDHLNWTRRTSEGCSGWIKRVQHEFLESVPLRDAFGNIQLWEINQYLWTRAERETIFPHAVLLMLSLMEPTLLLPCRCPSSLGCKTSCYFSWTRPTSWFGLPGVKHQIQTCKRKTLLNTLDISDRYSH